MAAVMEHDEDMRKMIWAAIFARHLAKGRHVEECARIADICLKDYDEFTDQPTAMESLRAVFLEIHDEKTSDAVLDDMTFEEGVVGAIDFLMGTDSEQAQRIINVIEAKKGVTK